MPFSKQSRASGSSRAHRPGTIASVAAVLALGLLGLTAVTPGESAALADIRTTPLLDDFDRPNENPLSGGGDWARTDSGIWTPLQLVDDEVTHQAGSGSSQSHWTAQSFDGDVEAWARAGGGGASGIGWGVALFRDVGGANAVDGYRFRVEVSTGGGSYALRRFDNGAQTLLDSASPAPTASPGWLLIRRNGSQVEGWRSADGVAWALAVSATDTTYTTGLHLSLGITDNSRSQLLGFDDFGGGASSTPSSGPPPGQSNGTCTGSGSLGLSGSRCLSDPVNTRTGAFVARVDDLFTPGTGVPLAWTRSYTSSDATAGPLGPGWTHTYAASLELEPNGDVLARGEEGQEVLFTRNADASFHGGAGARSSLRAVPGGYELVRNDQVAYAFDAQGRLLSIRDRNDRGVALAYDGQGRLATVTDAAGRRTTVSYNASSLVSQVETEDGRRVSYGYAAGRLTSVTDARGKQWTYTYDAGGRLATIVDPLGHTRATNAYAADGRVRSQMDAVGSTTTFAWDEQAETARVTDANGSVWRHEYEQGVLRRQVDPLGNVTELGHDPDLNETALTSPTNERTTMTYDAAGNLLTATAPPSLGSVRKTFAYNGRNDPTQVTDARDEVTSYTYTPAGNPETVTQDRVRVASYTYDTAGRVLTFTDGNEKTWTHSYLPAGDLGSVTDPLGNETTYTYDGAGRVSTRVDPKGNVPGCGCASQFTWRYTYDAAGHQLSEADPLGHVTTNLYDDAGRLTSTTDANGHTTRYEYDDADRLSRETAPDPDGAGPLAAPVTTYTYDDVGNELTETDPLGNTTAFGYDAANRLVSETGADPDGAGPLGAPVTTHAYDANGNLASSVEPRGNVSGADPADYRTSYTYDAAGRLLTTTDPLGNVSVKVYDAVGNVASARDANDHRTSYAHDAAGRTLTVTAPDTGVTSYAYDDAGNLLTRRDDNAHTTSYAYDAAGRLVSETSPDPDGPGPQGPAVTSFTYDPNGNRLTLTDPNGNATPTSGDGRTTYGYDRANRLTSIDYADATADVSFTYDDVGNRLTMTDASGRESRSYDGLDRLLTVTRGTNTFSYAYDRASNVTHRTYPGGTVADYGYDALNRLTSVASGGQTTSYAYDVASNLLTTTLPSGNGYAETRSYDRSGRLTEVESQRGATILSRFVSTLDPVGNPTQVVRTGSLAQTESYTYDASDRLTGVCVQAGGCPGANDPFVRWSYDGVGNRLIESRPSGTTAYTYDARDRLLSAGSTTYGYDQNGNELSAGSRTFAYDLANRLETTTQGSTTTSYVYDGDGVRLQTSTGSQSNRKTNFLWDTSFGLPQIAIERDGNSNPVRRYLYGVRRISQTAGNSTSYFVHDGLGSVSNLTSSSGATQWTWSYEPFGPIRTEQKASGKQPQSTMRFAGEYLDPTGLYHLRARQYDPASGRFLEPDPVGGPPNGSAVSAYAYAADRPTVMVDPSGEVFRPSSAALDALSTVVSPTDALAPPVALIPDGGGGGCAARAGYPLGVIGGFNGGRAAHRAKHSRGAPWESTEAVDLNVPVGTSVCAIFRGTVAPSMGFGLSSEGYRLHLVGATDIAFYTHLSRIVVRRGQSVEKGQLLGYSGCGSERVPHLHLALRRGNPDRYAPPYRKPVNYGGCGR